MIVEARRHAGRGPGAARELVERCPRGAARRRADSRAATRELWRWRDGCRSARHGAARRQGQRGHRGPAASISPRRSSRRSAIGERHGLPALQLRPRAATATCTRRSCSTRRRDRSSTRADARRRGALRARRRARRLGLRRARGRLVKRGQLARQWAPRALELHERDQARVRPQGAAQPRQEAGKVLCAAPVTTI